MKLPNKIQAALSKSTDSNRNLFDDSLKALQQLGLLVYSTNSPDLCVRHPRNDIVFCTLWFQSRAGARFERMVCPKTVLDVGVSPQRMRQYDAGSRARWALYPISSGQDIVAAIAATRNVMNCDPVWGR